MSYIEAERFCSKLEAKRDFQVINVTNQDLINRATVIYCGDESNLNF